MKKTRAHRRYSINHSQPIQAQVVAEPISIHLLTLGMGGLGFWLNEKDSSRIQVGDILTCKLGPRGGELVIKACVLYFHEYPKNGEMGKSFGLKFVEDHERIQGLIDSIECEEISEQA